jgi:hypothetical protein
MTTDTNVLLKPVIIGGAWKRGKATEYKGITNASFTSYLIAEDITLQANSSLFLDEGQTLNFLASQSLPEFQLKAGEKLYTFPNNKRVDTVKVDADFSVSVRRPVAEADEWIAKIQAGHDAWKAEHPEPVVA